MKRQNLLSLLLVIIMITACKEEEKEEINPLNGTWELVSSDYQLPNGQPDTTVNIKEGIRLFNDTHCTMFYETTDGTFMVYIADYDLRGRTLSFTFIHTTVPDYIGAYINGPLTINEEGNTFTHEMDIGGYIIKEEYKRIE